METFPNELFIVRTKPRVTIKDVANRAGCGVATASRVLNKSGSASEDAQQRVEKAARELGFSFSAIGRALQSRKTMTVACLVPSLANPVFAEAVQGVQSELNSAGYQLIVAASNYDPAADNRLLETFASQAVDGLIVTMIEPEQSDTLKAIQGDGMPVSLMFHDPIDGFCSAYVDNRAAAREVALQLSRLGHQHTGFLALKFSTSDRSRNRFAGFSEECRNQGLSVPSLIELAESDIRNVESLASILRQHSRLTALFASNDFLAIAVQKAAKLINVKVPEELSVIGFDGIEIGRILDKPLATIETQPEAMGRQAACSVLAMIDGHDQPQLPPLPYRFRRGSTLAEKAMSMDMEFL